jgi:ABC-type Fe3+/spermidine/putrescine transport system ATPase subunit
MAASSTLHLANVGKLDGTRWAVRSVTVTIAPGEFFTLLGPPGSGKSTLVRLMAGFLEPDVGAIFIDGLAVAGMPPWKRDLGLVVTHDALWPHLSVHEHIAFGLRERRVPAGELRERVEAALRMLGLDGLERRRPAQLSGGQRQRLALARTLVLQPRALLLDEPLECLDAPLRARMRDELRRLHGELGITTVYATHDQAEAMALSTRIAVLDRGELIQVGAPADVYRRPKTRFVGELLGAANLLPGRVTTGPSARVVKVKDGLTLTVAGSELEDGADVVCLVRPESIQRAPPEARHPNRIYATVASAVYLGGRWDCELALAGGLTLRAELPAAPAAPRVGEVVTVVVPPDEIVVLADGV